MSTVPFCGCVAESAPVWLSKNIPPGRVSFYWLGGHFRGDRIEFLENLAMLPLGTDARRRCRRCTPSADPVIFPLSRRSSRPSAGRCAGRGHADRWVPWTATLENPVDDLQQLARDSRPRVRRWLARGEKALV